MKCSILRRWLDGLFVALVSTIIFVQAPRMAEASTYEILVNVDLDDERAEFNHSNIKITINDRRNISCHNNYDNDVVLKHDCNFDRRQERTAHFVFDLPQVNSVRVSIKPSARWIETWNGAKTKARYRIVYLNRASGKRIRERGEFYTNSRHWRTLAIFPGK
jgi:hypothetical protein